MINLSLRFLFIISIFSWPFPFPAIGQDEPRPQATLEVESIEISGNTKTTPGVVRSFVPFREGDKINKYQLEECSRGLENSNFFKSVNVYTQPGKSRGTVVVFVEVKERHWPYFQFRGGFNELDGWYLSPIGLRFDNIFGRGNYMGIEFLIGDRLTGLDISYLRPSIMKSSLNFGVRLLTRSWNFVHYIDGDKYLQKVDNSGLCFRLNGNKGVMKYLWFDFVMESYTAQDFVRKAGDRDIEAALPEVLQPFEGKKNIGRFVVSLNLDSRNNPFYPTSGWWGSLSLDQVSTQLGSFTNYNKWILDLRIYQEITRKWVFAMKAKGGWISDQAPFYDSFYLGGPNSLRGYAERSLNPQGYASRLVLGSAEIRFPMTSDGFPRHFLTGVIFYDIGQAWNRQDSFQPDQLHSDVGYGFRVNIPFIGLVRLDFAYPVPDYDMRVVLSLGHIF